MKLRLYNLIGKGYQLAKTCVLGALIAVLFTFLVLQTTWDYLNDNNEY